MFLQTGVYGISGASALWSPTSARMVATIHVDGRQQTHVNTVVKSVVSPPPFRSVYTTLYCPFGDSFGKLKLAFP